MMLIDGVWKCETCGEMADAVGYVGRHVLCHKKLRDLELQVAELRKALKTFADLDCCTGYTLARDNYPVLWDALDEARRVLGYGPVTERPKGRCNANLIPEAAPTPPASAVCEICGDLYSKHERFSVKPTQEGA